MVIVVAEFKRQVRNWGGMKIAECVYVLLDSVTPSTFLRLLFLRALETLLGLLWLPVRAVHPSVDPLSLYILCARWNLSTGPLSPYRSEACTPYQARSCTCKESAACILQDRTTKIVTHGT